LLSTTTLESHLGVAEAINCSTKSGDQSLESSNQNPPRSSQNAKRAQPKPHEYLTLGHGCLASVIIHPVVEYYAAENAIRQ